VEAGAIVAIRPFAMPMATAVSAGRVLGRALTPNTWARRLGRFA